MVVLSIAVVQTIKQYRRIKRERLSTLNAALSAPDVEIEDALQSAEGEPSFSLDTSAAFGMPSTASPPPLASAVRLKPAQKKMQLGKSSSKPLDEESQEPEKGQHGSTCSKGNK